VKSIAADTDHRLPKGQITIATIRNVMNKAVNHLGVIFKTESAHHSTTCTVKLKSDLPGFLADEVAAHRLGYAPWNAFFSYSKHGCSCLCGDNPERCPVNAPVEDVVPAMREELGAILAAMRDPRRAVPPPPEDVKLAEKLLATSCAGAAVQLCDQSSHAAGLIPSPSAQLEKTVRASGPQGLPCTKVRSPLPILVTARVNLRTPETPTAPLRFSSCS
jgi:hypothetical protein